jgi:dihydroneopterin aldolase
MSDIRSNDRVLMRGFQLYGFHGVLPEETRLGQRFVVDVEISTDTRAAGRTDDLSKTVDYVSVFADVKAIVEGPPCKLIETVAERIAAAVLVRAGADAVRVKVCKPDVPIPVTLEYVGVEIFRRADSA